MPHTFTNANTHTRALTSDKKPQQGGSFWVGKSREELAELIAKRHSQQEMPTEQSLRKVAALPIHVRLGVTVSR